jgi:cell division protein ZapE
VTSAPRTVTERLSAEVAAGRLDVDPAQQDAAVRLDRLSEELRRRPRNFIQGLRLQLPWLPFGTDHAAHRGLYMWGGVGRGKTMLMDWFYDALRAPPAGRGARPIAERMHFYHFMRRVHSELRIVERRTRPLEAVAQRLAKRLRVICLDEFFVADIADAMILAGLFDGLFRRGVTLVATSNLPPQDLYKDGLQRQRFLPAIELIQKQVDVLHLDGGVDYRLRRLEQAPTYLNAAAPATTAALQRRFSALAAGADGGPATLSVEGRDLNVVNTAPGMVWFEFAELCEGPRSQNDYIEIARLYHTIFISNIPLFTEFNDDAARRFIMAVDELYDWGVNIVVSAAAPPEALYRGERLQMEFQRAASRLIEMQTHRYLAGQHRP